MEKYKLSARNRKYKEKKQMFSLELKNVVAKNLNI